MKLCNRCGTCCKRGPCIIELEDMPESFMSSLSHKIDVESIFHYDDEFQILTARRNKKGICLSYSEEHGISNCDLFSFKIWRDLWEDSCFLERQHSLLTSPKRI